MSQEFRDRCARAMGWTCKPVYRLSGAGPGIYTTNPLQGSYPMANCYSDKDGQAQLYGEWKPDEDYNHAMMMRDAIPVSWSRSYSAALKWVCEETGPLPPFETALQIATAALHVLEERQV